MLLPDASQPTDQPLTTGGVGEQCDGETAITVCDEETAITELTFLPDGRICLFGASREVLEVLGSLNLGDASLDSRLAALRRQTIES